MIYNLIFVLTLLFLNIAISHLQKNSTNLIILNIIVAIFAIVVYYSNNTVGLQNCYICSLSAIFRNTAILVFIIELFYV